MSKYKTLIFDLDGTVVNTDELIANTFLALYDAITPNVRRSKEELYYYSGPPLEDNLRNDYPEEMVDICAKTFREITDKLIETELVEYKDAKNTLESLKQKGYALTINTNRIVRFTSKILKTLKYDDLFSILMCPDFVKIGKPNPEGCLKIIEETKSRKEECLYIGDNNADFYTARNAGIDCVIVSWGPRKFKDDVKPVKFVKSFKELEDFILNGK